MILAIVDGWHRVACSPSGQPLMLRTGTSSVAAGRRSAAFGFAFQRSQGLRRLFAYRASGRAPSFVSKGVYQARARPVKLVVFAFVCSGVASGYLLATAGLDGGSCGLLVAAVVFLIVLVEFRVMDGRERRL